jgi:hypothetical protein
VKRLAVVVAIFALCSSASADDGRVIVSDGIRVTVPSAWHRVTPAATGVTDPVTLLVVGSRGTKPAATECQIASYAIPAGGASVVIVGWKETVSSHVAETGLRPLAKLTMTRPHAFECFPGRGAAASLVVNGRAYQVNVMVGRRATERQISTALAVARSFRLA